MALFHRIKSSFADNEPEPQNALSFEVQSVGDVLRRQRLALDIDITEAAEVLKIKPAYLAAIEEGCPNQLPGATYAVGFVRSYSQYLGLDSAELLRLFKLEAAELQAKPDLTFPMPLRESSLPAGRILTIAVILAACGYGIWYHLSAPGWTVPERVAEVPADLLPSQPALGSASKAIASVASARAPELHGPNGAPSELRAPAAKLAATAAANDSAGSVPNSGPIDSEPMAAGETSSPVKASPLTSAPIVAGTSRHVYTASLAPALPAVPTTIAPAANPSLLAPLAAAASVPGKQAVPASPASPPGLATTEASVVASREGTPEPTGAVSASPSGQDSTSAYGQAEDPSRITVRANADSWVQIRGANHSVLFTGILKPGETYRVPDRPGLTMRAGNAGGLDIIIDGKPAPAIGPNGAVRDVSLDPDTLAAQTPVHD